jgi:tetratricopeptide (TPR) repeat protein
MTSEEAQKLFEQAENFVTIENYGEALAYFDRALQKDPNFLEAWTDKGACHYKLKEYSEALRAFNQALAINARKGLPRDFDLLYNIGVALFYLERPEESVGMFREALEVAREKSNDEEIAKAANWLAWVLAHLNKDEEALDIIDIAYKLQPQDSTILDTRGMILFKLGYYETAASTLDAAIKKNPSSKYAWYNKANLLLKQEKYEQSIMCYEEALRLDKSFAEAYHGKGLALSHLKKETEAIRAIKKAIEIKPNFSDAHENLAKIVSAKRGSRLNFWDFWNKNKRRQATGIALAVFAFGSIIYYPFVSMLVPDFGGSITENNTTSDGSLINYTITKERSSEMPQYYLVMTGLAILVFLMPDIKSFKFGPLELETLTEPKPLESPPGEPGLAK